MGKSYKPRSIVERNIYFGGDRYRFFYTVNDAAAQMGMAKSNLLGLVKRNKVEHVLITDWDRNDTVQRAMIEEHSIVYERERVLAKKEKRKPRPCHYRQLVVTVKPHGHRVYLPASNYMVVGEIIRDYDGDKYEIEYRDVKSNVGENEPLTDIAEIYMKDRDVLQVIPYSILYRNAENRSTFADTDKFDVHLIMQFYPRTCTVQLFLDEWEPLKEKMLAEKDFSVLQERFLAWMDK
ncbi:hypothetical protein [Candidatus Uabimicrobium amorphum]|uniref:Uncharacterized protein n=1 Tax=Uabimicrobium amorphum TaxID=2596890 RepID=A0A5S9IRM9_UABAM|nr:hypothetical protein [Candidatus Uabimicrobium amorphum]BBM86839.1 hypothetical protein UABAM_05236 [Candidatus Uabimicrobium amorphum]